MPRLDLSTSPFARFLAILVVAGILISGLRVLEITHAATQYTWNGNNPPSTLSNAGNWEGNVAPSPGDDLLFPAGVRRKSIRNREPALPVENDQTFLLVCL